MLPTILKVDQSRSRVGATMRPITIFADPVRTQRVSLLALLDALDVQGPQHVALLRACVTAVAAEANPNHPDAAKRVGAAAIRVIKDEKMVSAGTKAELVQLAELVHTHICIALPELTPQLLQQLHRIFAIAPSWTHSGASGGSVDAAPTLDGPDAKLTFSQEEMHRVRHLLFCYLPCWTDYDEIMRLRRELFGAKADGAARRAAPLGAPQRTGVPVLRLPDSRSPPCAIVTVGPVGSGKSWVLRGKDSPIDSQMARAFGGMFTPPKLSEFCTLDPDAVLHSLCAGMGAGFDASLRPYANFVNHENFHHAIGMRKHIIFDGSARDPVNICGRVISRLRPAGYRVIFLVVLSSFTTARRRGIARGKETGRETTESFTRFVYKSLQKSLPIYLSSIGEGLAGDGVLFFTNDIDGQRPKLEYVLVGGPHTTAAASEHMALVKVAKQRGAELLALPP